MYQIWTKSVERYNPYHVNNSKYVNLYIYCKISVNLLPKSLKSLYDNQLHKLVRLTNRKCVRLPELDDNLTPLLWESLSIGLINRLKRAGVRGWGLAKPMKMTLRGCRVESEQSTRTSFRLINSVHWIRLGTWKEHKVCASIELIFYYLYYYLKPLLCWDHQCNSNYLPYTLKIPIVFCPERPSFLNP